MKQKPKLRIATLNFSGNVGKSTAAKYLILPRLHEARLFAVETINADELTEAETIKGRDFGALQEELFTLDSAVIDIGASNIEETIRLMKHYHGSHEDIDLFVVPVIPENKQIKDTIATISALSELGIPARKIRTLLNLTMTDAPPLSGFEALVRYHEAEKAFVLRPEAAMERNDLYAMLRGTELTIEQIVDDTTDLRAAMQKAESSEQKQAIARSVSMKRLATGLIGQLDAAFAALIK